MSKIAKIVSQIIRKAAPILGMNPVASGYFPDSDILILKNSISDMYLIKLKNGYMAIDTGAHRDEVEQGLKEYKINPAQVTHVFLTHSDSDHLATLGLYQDAKIYMSADEVVLLDGTMKRQAVVENYLPANIDLSKITLLKGDETLQIENHTIDTLKTPGHTPGSMTFIVDEKYVFSGDSVSFKNNQMKPHPFTMDKKEARLSMDKIQVLYNSGLTILTAHYGIHKK